MFQNTPSIGKKDEVNSERKLLRAVGWVKNQLRIGPSIVDLTQKPKLQDHAGTGNRPIAYDSLSLPRKRLAEFQNYNAERRAEEARRMRAFAAAWRI